MTAAGPDDLAERYRDRLPVCGSQVVAVGTPPGEGQAMHRFHEQWAGIGGRKAGTEVT
ncbi:MAG TPA: hypothetical protein VIM86_08235 [Thermodesulfobacteriota bacterium]